jgi:hypothetical protein
MVDPVVHNLRLARANDARISGEGVDIALVELASISVAAGGCWAKAGAAGTVPRATRTRSVFMFFKMCLLRFCTGGAYAENHRSSVRRLTSVVKFLTSRVAVSGPTPTIWPNSRSSVILLCQIFDGFTACGKGSGVEAVGRPPSGPGWVHEIKHDGYRLIVRRDGEAVRLFIGAAAGRNASAWVKGACRTRPDRRSLPG